MLTKHFFQLSAGEINNTPAPTRKLFMTGSCPLLKLLIIRISDRFYNSGNLLIKAALGINEGNQTEVAATTKSRATPTVEMRKISLFA